MIRCSPSLAGQHFDGDQSRHAAVAGSTTSADVVEAIELSMGT